MRDKTTDVGAMLADGMNTHFWVEGDEVVIQGLNDRHRITGADLLWLLIEHGLDQTMKEPCACPMTSRSAPNETIPGIGGGGFTFCQLCRARHPPNGQIEHYRKPKERP